MSLEVARSRYYTRQSIKRLIVNGQEKYRLIIGNVLKYAKGKINFDINLPTGGVFTKTENNIWHPFKNKNVYAFYDDGFYYYYYRSPWEGTDKFVKIKEGSLSENIKYGRGGGDWNNDWRYSYTYNRTLGTQEEEDGVVFKGWWTQKNGGDKITTIRDVYTKTDLFDFKDTDALPEITLYAHWEIRKFTITINNIKNNDKICSYFYHKGKKITNQTYQLNGVPYGVHINSYLNGQITGMKYITWAKNVLSEKKEKELRAGPQKFLGWSAYGDGTWEKKRNGVSYNWGTNEPPGRKEGLIDDRARITKNMTVYLNFESIVIYPKMKLPSGKNFGGKYVLFDKPAHWTDYVKYKNGGTAPKKLKGLKADDNDGYWYHYSHTKNGKKYYESYIWTPWHSAKLDWNNRSLQHWLPYSSTAILTLSDEL